MSPVASFDVFDTLLTRTVGAPSSVFLLLGRRLAATSLIPCSAEAFARARAEAEQRAYRNAGATQVTLRRIYAELQCSLALTDEARDVITREECALEQELLRPVPDAKERVQQARGQGSRIIFVSDMYLPSTFIREQLARHGLWQEGDAIYMSCEHGALKSNGLFSVICATEQVSPGQWSHTGDHPQSDLEAARRIGAQTSFFSDTHLNRYERVWESDAFATEGLSSAFAGASRLARLTVPVSCRRDAVLRDMTASVIAPMLVGFVLWILRRTQQLNVTRLYFVSRDGQVLLEIAKRLAASLNIACELRYLYGSRQAWHLPAVTEIGEKELDWILDEGESIRSILARVGLEPAQIREQLEALGVPESDWLRQLVPDERSSLKKLFQAKEVRDLILKAAETRRPVTLDYFKQEGLLEPMKWAIVDLGWQGRMQDSLAQLVMAGGGVIPHGFYFGLRQRRVDGEVGEREAYLFDHRLGVGFGNIGFRVSPLLEIACVGDHGLVNGYERAEHTVSPKLTTERNRAAIEWGLPILRTTIQLFLDHLTLDPKLVNPFADLRAATARVLTAFWLDPTAAEAAVIGEFIFANDQADVQKRFVASPYRWRHTITAFLTGRIPPHHQYSWREGSLAITPRPKRNALDLAVRPYRLLDQFCGKVVRALHLGALRARLQGALRPRGVANPLRNE